MVLEKFSFKDSKFYKECMAHYLFCHPLILQFSWLVFPSILLADEKMMKIAQIAQVNQLFQLSAQIVYMATASIS